MPNLAREPLTGVTLLVLDDDAFVGQTICAMAASAGVIARHVVSPRDFFAELDGWQPTHVAVDLAMPEMDGVEILRQLGNAGASARVIVTSGLGARVLEAARRSADEHGLTVAGVLRKPFSVKALRDLLTRQDGVLPPGNGRAHGGEREVDFTATGMFEALRRQEFTVAYQPKIFCATGELAGFEALARWRDPRRGIVGPGTFVPFAEQNGMIDELSQQIYRQALEWLAGQFPKGDISLSLNLSAKTLSDIHLADRMFASCREFGIDPGRVIFELTETTAIEDPTASLDLMTRLRVKGFQLSIDDFGTGFSSLAQLVRLPFSEMKIDKSFVMRANEPGESRTVVQAIIALSHSLGLRVTAEGVEDQAVLELLRGLKCDQAQGFLIGRPLVADDVGQWLQSFERRHATLVPAAR